MLKEVEKLFVDRNAHRSVRIKFTTFLLQESVNVALNPLLKYQTAGFHLHLQTFITFCHPLLV